VNILYLICVWLHILAVTVWLGGTLFLVLVLVPLMRRPGLQNQAATLIHEVGLRFRRVGWICLIVIVSTGVGNLYFRGYRFSSLSDGAIWLGVLGLKLLVVILIVLVSLVHDFWAGPRASALMETRPAAPETRRSRRLASWMGRLNLLLGLAAVALGVILVRGLP